MILNSQSFAIGCIEAGVFNLSKKIYDRIDGARQQRRTPSLPSALDQLPFRLRAYPCNFSSKQVENPHRDDSRSLVISHREQGLMD